MSLEHDGYARASKTLKCRFNSCQAHQESDFVRNGIRVTETTYVPLTLTSAVYAGKADKEPSQVMHMLEPDTTTTKEKYK